MAMDRAEETSVFLFSQAETPAFPTSSGAPNSSWLLPMAILAHLRRSAGVSSERSVKKSFPKG